MKHVIFDVNLTILFSQLKDSSSCRHNMSGDQVQSLFSAKKIYVFGHAAFFFYFLFFKITLPTNSLFHIFFFNAMRCIQMMPGTFGVLISYFQTMYPNLNIPYHLYASCTSDQNFAVPLSFVCLLIVASLLS